MKYPKVRADDLDAHRFGNLKKWVLVSTLLVELATGPALAASFGYEKNVVKLLQKNPGLAPEIVEALKDCRLAKGMTEEQATVVGRRWTRLPGRVSGLFDTGIDRKTTKDEQGRKFVTVSFYTQLKTASRPSMEHVSTKVVELALHFVNGELMKWDALSIGVNDTDRAKIRQGIEDRLAGSRIKEP